jgi:hypothetical protein
MGNNSSKKFQDKKPVYKQDDCTEEIIKILDKDVSQGINIWNRTYIGNLLTDKCLRHKIVDLRHELGAIAHVSYDGKKFIIESTDKQ